MKPSASLLAILLLSGCAGPKAQLPQNAIVEPPTGWRSGATNSGEITADWWRSFNDPALTAIVETALANNTDIAIAATRVAEARAEYRLARAESLPNVDRKSVV